MRKPRRRYWGDQPLSAIRDDTRNGIIRVDRFAAMNEPRNQQPLQWRTQMKLGRAIRENSKILPRPHKRSRRNKLLHQRVLRLRSLLGERQFINKWHPYSSTKFFKIRSPVALDFSG